MSKVVMWILGIAVVVLIGFLISKNNESVSDTFGDISEDLMECRADLNEWELAYPSGATTPDAQADLDAIMERCEKHLENAQGTLGGDEEETTPAPAN